MLDNSATSMTTYQVLLPQKNESKGDALQALFQKWIDEDTEQEISETFEYLVDAVDRDRLSYRKLFQ